jgi:hypothetical protein
MRFKCIALILNEMIHFNYKVEKIEKNVLHRNLMHFIIIMVM